MGMMSKKRLVYGGLALLVLAGLRVSCVASGLLEAFLSSFYVVGIRP